MNYRGAYAAATPYADGDIVVYNGIAYMCVRPTTSPPAVWPMAPGTSAYGTTLPASPYDGQEAVLVDSLTNPSYQWRFRYNAGSSSPYKWEFVGGYPASANVYTTEGTSSGTYVDLATVGPSLVVSRAGEYRVDFGYFATNPGNSGQGNSQSALHVNNVNTGYPAVAWVPSPSGTGNTAVTDEVLTLAAGDALRLKYVISNGLATNFSQRWLSLTPKRVA